MSNPISGNSSVVRADLLESLQKVHDAVGFGDWVRRELRYVLPHASFLATVGRMLGLGSVPTHRISVEFPLTIVEELKNATGAINDPLASGWFRNGKLRHVNLAQFADDGPHGAWKGVLSRYGYRDILIHGAINHEKHYFVLFHFANIHARDSLQSVRMICDLVEVMATTAYRAVSTGCFNGAQDLLWNPTSTLTPAEIHIIELIARGFSNKEIARLRGVSDSTVKTQVSRTGAKLGATRRAEIVAIAMSFLAPFPAQTMFQYEMRDASLPLARGIIKPD